MGEIIVIIDTSILRKHISLNTPEFDLLAELSRINAIKFKIPEMVDNEFQSQKIAEIESHYNKILTALKHLQNKNQSRYLKIEKEHEKFLKAKKQAVQEIENEWKRYKLEKNISIIPFSTTATNKVFKDYVEGNPPFKNIKNRNDLPDAFILQSILNLVNKKNIHFVCADTTLSESVSKNEIKTYESIKSFLELPEVRLKINELENLSSVRTELDLIKNGEPTLSDWVSNHIKEDIPIDLYTSFGRPSKHKDKLVKIFGIKSIKFDFNKSRLYNSKFLVIPSSIEASIEIEMIYSQNEYLKLTSPPPIKKIYELMKLKENDEGVTIREPYTGTLNLTLKIDVSSPFKLQKKNVTFSDVTKEFLMTDMLNDIIK